MTVTPGVDLFNRYDFGQLPLDGSAGPVTFTATNNGAVPTSTIQSITPWGGSSPDFQVTDDQCSGHALALNDTCTFQVTATDPGTCSGQVALGQFALDQGSPNGFASDVGMKATEASTPCVTWTPASHDFGTTSGTQTFTLTNTGTTPVRLGPRSDISVIDPTISGSLGWDVSQLVCFSQHAGPFGADLAVGASCSIDLTFAQAPVCGTHTYFAATDFSIYTDASLTSYSQPFEVTAPAQQTPCLPSG